MNGPGRRTVQSSTSGSLSGSLQEEITQRDHEIIRLQTRIRKIRTVQDQKIQKNSEIATRDAVIQSLKQRFRKVERSNKTLRKRLERMKEFDEMLAQNGEVIPLKVLSSFTREGLKALIDEIGVKEGDLLVVAKIDGWGRGLVKDLGEMGISALIAGAVGDPQSVRGLPGVPGPAPAGPGDRGDRAGKIRHYQ